MTQMNAGAVSSPDRFDQIEALLIRYPRLSKSELADLKHWFRKEASAFEVATFASKESTSTGYDQFRAEHVDRFSTRDIVVAGSVLALVALTIAMSWAF
ncbi:hypothetical protein [Tsuneonella sp. HG222]